MQRFIKNNKVLLSIHNVRQNIVGADMLVSTRGGQRRPYINFDNAASTPALAQVLNKVHDFMPWYAAVHRGAGLKSQVSTREYEKARIVVRDFLGAHETEHVVIFGKNTTESINKLAYRLALSKNDVVITSLLEHHSNDLPWRGRAELKRVRLTPEGGLDVEHFKQLLGEYAGRVKLVAISGASNVTGHLPDIHYLAMLTHRAGAHIMIDAAQLAAHRPIAMKPLADPGHLDYVALSAHKMYAPFGSGALVGRRDTFANGQPELVGGGTIKSVTLDDVDWAEPPDRDEAGSPNVVGVIAMAEAARALQSIGMDNIAKHENALVAYALDKLGGLHNVTLYGDPVRVERSSVITFNLRSMPHALVAAILNYEWGIGVRNGCFCAQPYVAELLHLRPPQIQSAWRDSARSRRNHLPGMVRVSFGMYNTFEEIDTLIRALEAIAQRKFGDYRQDLKTGEFTPKPSFA